MKENLMNFRELNNNQRRIFIDAVHIYEAYIEASRIAKSYSGGMHWKRVKGNEYLFRQTDRFGNGKSMGRRSKKTEQIMREFKRGKTEAKLHLNSISEELIAHTKFCKAASIQRVPQLATKILRRLNEAGLLGSNFIVVGTNALYAYEAAAGVVLPPSLTATNDLDILWDTGSKLTLAAHDLSSKNGLLEILRRVDKSFRPMAKNGFHAVTQNGYMVDLIKPIPRTMWGVEPDRIGGPGDLVAAEIRNLKWLIASPKFSQTVIGQDGFPVQLCVPDPRAFALHKLWLSEQDDRSAIQKPRDAAQGVAVFEMIVDYLPQYKFRASELRMFPKKVIERVQKKLEKLALPEGLRIEID